MEASATTSAPRATRSPLVISGAIGACIGLLISAVLGVRHLAQVQADAAALPVVEVATVAPGRIRSELVYTGLVQAPQQATVTSLSAGTLTSLTAAVGATVRAGDRLGNLTTESLPAQLQQAQADLRAAEARRAQLLAGARSTDVDSARAVLTAAEAKLAQLRSPSTTDVATARSTLASAESTLASNEAAIETNRALLFGAIANACTLPAGQGIPVPCAAPEAPLSTKTADDLAGFLQSRAGAPGSDLSQRAIAVLQANNSYRSSFGAAEAARQSVASARAKLDALLNPSTSDVAGLQAQVQVARDSLENKLNPYTDADVQAASAAVARAAAQVAITEASLARTAIVAPFDGVIAQRLVEPGANVTTQTPIYVVVGNGAQVVVTLRDTDAADIKPGTAVEITTPESRNPVTGRVLSVAPIGDTRGHTLEVRISTENPAGSMRPGTLAQVRLITTEKGDALAVPTSALSLGDQGARVWVVAEGRAQPRPVTVGIADRTNTEITKGLKAERCGDRAGLRDAAREPAGEAPARPRPLVLDAPTSHGPEAARPGRGAMLPALASSGLASVEGSAALASAQKPIPVATEHDQPYWDALKEHRFVLQHCTQCGLFSAQPRVVCPRCHTDAHFEWAAPSGRAKIHSYTIVYQTFTPGFDDEIPYVICHAQLEEEPTCFVTANLAVDQADFEKLDIDLPLVIDYDDRGEATVPLWRLAEGK